MHTGHPEASTTQHSWLWPCDRQRVQTCGAWTATLSILWARQWTFGWLPLPGYREECCCEYLGSYCKPKLSFDWVADEEGNCWAIQTCSLRNCPHHFILTTTTNCASPYPTDFKEINHSSSGMLTGILTFQSFNGLHCQVFFMCLVFCVSSW